MSATTRRGALRGASLVGLLGIPAAALGTRSSTANPDAGLIALCDRIVALQLGRVVFDGPPPELTGDKVREIYGIGEDELHEEFAHAAE